MYKEDTPQILYDQMVKIENEIESVGRNIKVLAEAEANAVADYEQKKNNYLIVLYTNESQKGGKRTEKQREALYRSIYANERLAMFLAKSNLQSERDLLGALKAKLQGIQSRKGIMMSEMDISGRRG